MLLKPLRNKVLIKPVKTSKKSKGRIFLPESSTKLTPYAVVVSIGDKVDGDSIKIGAKICYASRNPIAVESEGGKMFIIDDNEIVAVIEEDGE